MIMFSECQKKNRSINGKIIDNHQVKTAIVKERWRDDAVSLQVIQNLFFNRTLQKQKHLNCFSSCPHVEPNTFSLPNYVTSGMKEEETCRSDTAAENHRHWVERPGFPDVKPPLSEYFVTFCSSVSLSRVPHLTYAHIAFSPYFQKFIYIQPSCPLNLLGPFFCGVTKLDQLLVAWFRLQQASFGHHCKSEELRLTPPPSSARVSETLPHPQTSSVHHDKPCASAADRLGHQPRCFRSPATRTCDGHLQVSSLFPPLVKCGWWHLPHRVSVRTLWDTGRTWVDIHLLSILVPKLKKTDVQRENPSFIMQLSDGRIPGYLGHLYLWLHFCHRDCPAPVKTNTVLKSLRSVPSEKGSFQRVWCGNSPRSTSLIPVNSNKHRRSTCCLPGILLKSGIKKVKAPQTRSLETTSFTVHFPKHIVYYVLLNLLQHHTPCVSRTHTVQACGDMGISMSCSREDKAGTQAGAEHGETLSHSAMKVRRRKKSNLAGRIRKTLVKEAMFLYMGGVSGDMTGRNPTRGHFFLVKTHSSGSASNATCSEQTPHSVLLRTCPALGPRLSGLAAVDLFTHVPPSLGCKVLLRVEIMFYVALVTDVKVPENSGNSEAREFYIYLSLNQIVANVYLSPHVLKNLSIGS